MWWVWCGDGMSVARWCDECDVMMWWVACAVYRSRRWDAGLSDSLVIISTASDRRHDITSHRLSGKEWRPSDEERDSPSQKQVCLSVFFLSVCLPLSVWLAHCLSVSFCLYVFFVCLSVSLLKRSQYWSVLYKHTSLLWRIKEILWPNLIKRAFHTSVYTEQKD